MRTLHRRLPSYTSTASCYSHFSFADNIPPQITIYHAFAHALENNRAALRNAPLTDGLDPDVYRHADALLLLPMYILISYILYLLFFFFFVCHDIYARNDKSFFFPIQNCAFKKVFFFFNYKLKIVEVKYKGTF